MKVEQFRLLCKNFNKEPEEDLYLLWKQNLRCYDEEEIQKAISIIISQDQFFPTFRRILEVIKNVVNKENSQVSEEFKRAKMKSLKIKPSWLDKELTSEIEEDIEFKNFIQEFRNS